jgi:hypothetical protein
MSYGGLLHNQGLLVYLTKSFVRQISVKLLNYSKIIQHYNIQLYNSQT